MDKLAEALGVSPGWLAFGDERIDQISKETIDLALKIEAPDEQQKKMLMAMLDATDS